MMEGGCRVSATTATRLRRKRKEKNVAVSKKTLICVISLISALSIILLLPLFSQSLLAYASTLLSLSTLFLFGGMIVYLAIRLLMMLGDWNGSGKHAADSVKFSRLENGELDPQPIKSTVWWDLGGIVVISMWAFILKLLYPFFITMIWWQGYKLMGGKGFSLGTIEGTIRMVEYLVYFGIAVFLILLSRHYWRCCARRNRYIAK